MDDDQGGIFHFESEETNVEENDGEVDLKIIRSAGVKGRVEVPFTIQSITAIPGHHYEEPVYNSVIFQKRETE